MGLDPHPSDLPAPTAEAALEFCLRLIKATARYAAAYKPNAAFFEVFGAEGWTALRMVVEAVAEESNRTGSVIPVILDAKRGDITSTAEAYAQAAFEKLGAHAITLSPYLGQDSVAPFLVNREKGVFLLRKTSNPGNCSGGGSKPRPTAAKSPFGDWNLADREAGRLRCCCPRLQSPGNGG